MPDIVSAMSIGQKSAKKPKKNKIPAKEIAEVMRYMVEDPAELQRRLRTNYRFLPIDKEAELIERLDAADFRSIYPEGWDLEKK